MSADLLQRLAEAGTPMALIMEVAETLAEAKAAERLLERRREKDRVRKRNSTDSVETVENAESAETPSPPNKSPPDPQKLTPPPMCVGDAPARKGQFPVPEGCSPDDWRDLLANRKAKRQPMTPAAYRKLLRDLASNADEEWPPGRILAHAAERGWAAIFDPRQSQGSSRHGRPANDLQNPLARAAVLNEHDRRNRADDDEGELRISGSPAF